MKKLLLLGLAFLAVLSTGVGRLAAREPDGASLFWKHCSGCHRNPAKFNVDTDIIYVLRKPPLAMPAFDREKISDSGATSIRDYIRLQIKLKSLC